MARPTLRDQGARGTGLLEDVDGRIVGGPVDRLIERLLDQLDERRRLAFDGEDTFLRRAIHCYAVGAMIDACHNAWSAAKQGSNPLAHSSQDGDSEHEALAGHGIGDQCPRSRHGPTIPGTGTAELDG